MQTYRIKQLSALVLLGAVLLAGCKKQDEFLNYKRANADVMPSNLTDYQALLDNNGTMNANTPICALIGTDNYYIAATTYNAAGVPSGTCYTWATDPWQGYSPGDWGDPYVVVEYANVVLDGIQKIGVGSDSANIYNNIEGSALFYRSFAFYNLAGEFCKPYTASTASKDPGIPLRQTSDFNVPSVRSTVQQTYDQITGDLKKAIPLLPVSPLTTTRPSKMAANALLAKVYLSMEQYDSALLYANNTLTLKSDLMDFNNTTYIKASANVPFPTKPDQNPEMIFFAETLGSSLVWPLGSGITDSTLFSSYDVNDLRKSVLYKINNGNPIFKGTYDGYGTYNFGGIATNEIYLIRAECNTRKGNVSTALQDYNLLLRNRHVTGTYTDLVTTNADSLLAVVLYERRKELPFTSFVRWEDLRRLNKDPRFAITLTRNINGTIYTLPPNDLNYVYPFPDQEIQLTSMAQNPRD